MRVVKEAWLLESKIIAGDFLLMQNTATPKLYVSKGSAKSAGDYYASQHNNGIVMHKPVKAFIVIEDEGDGNDEAF